MSKEDPGLAAIRRAGHSRRTRHTYRRKYKRGCSLFFISLASLAVIIWSVMQ